MRVPSELSLLHLRNSQMLSHLKIDQKQVEKMTIRNKERECRYVNLFATCGTILCHLNDTRRPTCSHSPGRIPLIAPIWQVFAT
jgi:hypothetical protein